MHHLNSATSETESHGPKGALTSPICDLVHCCSVADGISKAPNIDSQVGMTYKAYCIAPSFFSWLGRGTSLRGLPVTLSGGPSAFWDGVTCVVAAFDDVEEMNADGPARKARRAVVGLAMHVCWSVTGGNGLL